MAVLALAAALQMAASCAPAVAPETWLSIVHAESKLDTLAIGDNTSRQSYHPASLGDAVALATRLVAAGHNLDLGVSQINTGAGHLQRRSLPLAAAFDPCIGFRVGGEVLTECYHRAAGPDEQARLLRAISCYNGGGAGYVQRVQASAAHIVPAIRVIGAAPDPLPAMTDLAAPVSCAPAWDAWALAECSARITAPPPADPTPAAETVTAIIGIPHASE